MNAYGCRFSCVMNRDGSNRSGCGHTSGLRCRIHGLMVISTPCKLRQRRDDAAPTSGTRCPSNSNSLDVTRPNHGTDGYIRSASCAATSYEHEDGGDTP